MSNTIWKTLSEEQINGIHDLVTEFDKKADLENPKILNLEDMHVSYVNLTDKNSPYYFIRILRRIVSSLTCEPKLPTVMLTTEFLIDVLWFMTPLGIEKLRYRGIEIVYNKYVHDGCVYVLNGNRIVVDKRGNVKFRDISCQGSVKGLPSVYDDLRLIEADDE